MPFSRSYMSTTDLGSGGHGLGGLEVSNFGEKPRVPNAAFDG